MLLVKFNKRSLLCVTCIKISPDTDDVEKSLSFFFFFSSQWRANNDIVLECYGHTFTGIQAVKYNTINTIHT